MGGLPADPVGAVRSSGLWCVIELSATRIVFVRHGETDYNRDARVQGQVDIPLNEDGRAEARLMAPRVAALHPCKVVSSDLARAVETAQAIVDAMSKGAPAGALSVVREPLLRERAFGRFEGLSRDQMERDFPEEYARWRQTGECAEVQIEGRASVGERVCRAVHAHVSEGQTTVFVSHGSAITQAIVTLLGLDPTQWMGLHGLNNCHWSILDATTRQPGWRLVAHNLGAFTIG